MYAISLYHCWSELGDGTDIRRTKFVGSLLWAAHALVLATKVFLTGKKFECAYV